MGLVLVLGWRLSSWPSLLSILERPRLLFLPKAPTLHVHFSGEGKTSFGAAADGVSCSDEQ